MSGAAARVVLVANLPPFCSSAEVAELAASFGELEGIVQVPLQQAFIEFSDAQAARSLVEYCRDHDTTMHGYCVSATFSPHPSLDTIRESKPTAVAHLVFPADSPPAPLEAVAAALAQFGTVRGAVLLLPPPPPPHAPAAAGPQPPAQALVEMGAAAEAAAAADAASGRALWRGGPVCTLHPTRLASLAEARPVAAAWGAAAQAPPPLAPLLAPTDLDAAVKAGRDAAGDGFAPLAGQAPIRRTPRAGEPSAADAEDAEAVVGDEPGTLDELRKTSVSSASDADMGWPDDARTDPVVAAEVLRSRRNTASSPVPPLAVTPDMAPGAWEPARSVASFGHPQYHHHQHHHHHRRRPLRPSDSMDEQRASNSLAAGRPGTASAAAHPWSTTRALSASALHQQRDGGAPRDSSCEESSKESGNAASTSSSTTGGRAPGPGPGAGNDGPHGDADADGAAVGGDGRAVDFDRWAGGGGGGGGHARARVHSDFSGRPHPHAPGRVPSGDSGDSGGSDGRLIAGGGGGGPAASWRARVSGRGGHAAVPVHAASLDTMRRARDATTSHLRTPRHAISLDDRTAMPSAAMLGGVDPPSAASTPFDAIDASSSDLRPPLSPARGSGGGGGGGGRPTSRADDRSEVGSAPRERAGTRALKALGGGADSALTDADTSGQEASPGARRRASAAPQYTASHAGDFYDRSSVGTGDGSAPDEPPPPRRVVGRHPAPRAAGARPPEDRVRALLGRASGTDRPRSAPGTVEPARDVDMDVLARLLMAQNVTVPARHGVPDDSGGAAAATPSALRPGAAQRDEGAAAEAAAAGAVAAAAAGQAQMAGGGGREFSAEIAAAAAAAAHAERMAILQQMHSMNPDMAAALARTLAYGVPPATSAARDAPPGVSRGFPQGSAAFPPASAGMPVPHSLYGMGPMGAMGHVPAPGAGLYPPAYAAAPSVAVPRGFPYAPYPGMHPYAGMPPYAAGPAMYGAPSLYGGASAMYGGMPAPFPAYGPSHGGGPGSSGLAGLTRANLHRGTPFGPRAGHRHDAAPARQQAAPAATGLAPSVAAGWGRVVRVGPLPPRARTPQAVFNLVSNYDNVVCVRLEPGGEWAMVELATAGGAEDAVSMLAGKPLMGRPLQLAAVPDQERVRRDAQGGAEVVDYTTSPLNRFLRRPRKHIHEPSDLLHVSNLDQSTLPGEIEALFADAGYAPAVRGLKLFERKSRKQVWVKMETPFAAMDALTELHNSPVRDSRVCISFSHFKGAFEDAELQPPRR